MSKPIPSLLTLLPLCMLLYAGESSDKARAADKVDNSIYSHLLNKFLKNGKVDYGGFKEEEDVLDRYLLVLEHTNTETLSRNDQFAFYINAYNAWTIKLILQNYPGIKSIKDVGGFFSSPWKKKICRIDGQVVSLDHIEHEILRPGFKDPRVHFAVNCASKGCPILQPNPFEGNLLGTQLDEATTGFINNPERNNLQGKTLYVSKIFDWFEKDFHGDVLGFFRKYAKGDFGGKLEKEKEGLRIKYLEYDWSLNGE